MIFQSSVIVPVKKKDRVRKTSFYDYGGESKLLEPADRTYKVVLAGDASVGKSTFISRICHGQFNADITSTLGVDYKMKSLVIDDKHIVLQLWDTAGQEKFRSITKSYFRRADGVMLLYDVTSERSFTNVRHWVQDIDDVSENRIPFILCGNKADLKEKYLKEGRTIVATSHADHLAKEYTVPFFETSSKTGDGITEAVAELSRKMEASEDLAVKSSALRVTGESKQKHCCNI